MDQKFESIDEAAHLEALVDGAFRHLGFVPNPLMPWQWLSIANERAEVLYAVIRDSEIRVMIATFPRAALDITVARLPFTSAFDQYIELATTIQTILDRRVEHDVSKSVHRT